MTRSSEQGYVVKLFFIIMAAILVSAAVIALVIGVSNAKYDHDKFMQDSQRAIDDAKRQQNPN